MRILRIKDVIEITGLGRSTIYRYIAQEQFPKPIKLNGELSTNAAVGWSEEMINRWFENTKELNNV